MENRDKLEVERISKGFASGFKDTIGGISGSGWLIVDPLSSLLNHSGFENTIEQIPATEKNPQVLILKFKDGTQFIPAGGDLVQLQKDFKDWMWL